MKIKILSVFALYSYVNFIYSDSNINFPSLEPLFTCSNKKDLTGEEIIMYGLQFSLNDINTEKSRKIIEKYREVENIVKSDVYLNLPEEQRGEKILELIYKKVLKYYSLNQSYIDVMFLEGSYNCVSSSLLFYALAKESGLNVVANETPEHAFCSVYLSDGRKIDVETTNPYGFNPGTKKNIVKTATSIKYHYAEKKEYLNRKEISEKKLICLIGSNISSRLEQRGFYNKAIPLVVTLRYFIDGGPESEVKAIINLLESICHNYAIFLDKKKKEEEALYWLDLVEEKFGEFKNLKIKEEYAVVLYNCVVCLVNKCQAEKANAIFIPRKGKIIESTRKSIENIIFYALISEKGKTMKPDEAISMIHEKKEKILQTDNEVLRKLEDLEEYFWIKKSEQYTKLGKYLEGADIISEGLKFLPKNKNLKTVKKQCLNNYCILIHNKFVSFYNKRDFKEAKEILKEGLRNVPDNYLLLDDFSKFNK